MSRPCCLECIHHKESFISVLCLQANMLLQVKNAAGSWISADPIPDTLVCNIGDMLRVWSNGLYEPTAHRVINADLTASRVSVPFFYEPSFEAVIKPLSQLITADRPACALPIRYGSHLESKVLNNFELETAKEAVVG